jgi:ATP-dependent Clp protease ATP-binding subunit ClpX
LKFDKETLDFIVEKAIEYKLGARGLRSICEAILLDAMYLTPGNNEKDFTVSISYAKNAFKKSKLSQLKVA